MVHSLINFLLLSQMIAKRIHVRGKVQGVFFRASTKEKADMLCLTGWVKNERDGSVSLEVFGKEDLVNQLENWCQYGPPLAVVNAVESQDIPFQEYFEFRIVY